MSVTTIHTKSDFEHKKITSINERLNVLKNGLTYISYDLIIINQCLIIRIRHAHNEARRIAHYVFYCRTEPYNTVNAKTKT